MELHEAIMTRRSVRKFTDHYVTDDEIAKLLEAAQWAPSWKNSQCWEFIVIRDRELMKKVADTYSATNPSRKCSETASVLIAVCGKSDLPGYMKGEQETKFDSWFMFDLGITVQNIALRAHDLGLGTVVVGLMDHNKCADLLNVKSPYEVVAILPIGQPVEFKKEGPKRREIAEFTHKDTFGNK